MFHLSVLRDIVSTQEMFNTVGNAVSKLMGYHVECGDIMSTAGGFSTLRDTMSMLGGCSVHWGFHTNLIVSPMILPTFIMIAPSVLTISPHCTAQILCRVMMTIMYLPDSHVL